MNAHARILPLRPLAAAVLLAASAGAMAQTYAPGVHHAFNGLVGIRPRLARRVRLCNGSETAFK